MADFWMYPNDVYDVSVDWSGSGIVPTASVDLAAVEVTVFDVPPTDVTDTVLAASGADGLVSYGTIHNAVAGKLYTVQHRATFGNGEVRDKFVTLEVRAPRLQVLPQLSKYPNDAMVVPVSWAGRMPRGATALGAVSVKAFNDADADVSGSYVQWGQSVGPYSVAKLFGGTGGESRLIEYGQRFNNGRMFHDYAMLTVKVPPA